MIISVGGIGIHLKDSAAVGLPDNLHPYVVRDVEPVAHCSGEYGPVPQWNGTPPLFDSGWTWRVDPADSGIRLSVQIGESSKSPYQVLDLNEDLTAGRAVIDDSQVPDQEYPFVLRDPLHELWTCFLLMRGRGLLVHGLGVLIDSSVHLFVGKSGVGKSTLAKVFEKSGVGEILSDDRLIIRSEKQGYTVYGTPWHGEARFYSANCGPLGSINFLRQSPFCRRTRLPVNQVAAKLFVVCFLAGWPRNTGIQYVLDSCVELASFIPCYDLDFTPDERAIREMGVIL